MRKEITFNELKKILSEAYTYDKDAGYDKLYNDIPDDTIPCPKCGNKPTWQRNGVGYSRLYCLHCMKPLQKRYAPTLKQAIDAWNDGVEI